MTNQHPRRCKRKLKRNPPYYDHEPVVVGSEDIFGSLASLQNGLGSIEGPEQVNSEQEDV